MRQQRDQKQSRGRQYRSLLARSGKFIGKIFGILVLLVTAIGVYEKFGEYYSRYRRDIEILDSVGIGISATGFNSKISGLPHRVISTSTYSETALMLEDFVIFVYANKIIRLYGIRLFHRTRLFDRSP